MPALLLPLLIFTGGSFFGSIINNASEPAPSPVQVPQDANVANIGKAAMYGALAIGIYWGAKKFLK